MNRRLMLSVLAVTLVCSALMLAACSDKSKTPDTSTEISVDATTEPPAWSLTSDCSECHADEMKSVQDATVLASKHSTMTCADCHTDSAALTTAHAGATEGAVSDATKKLATKDFCLKCHGTYEELAAKTAASSALMDADGTSVNPHGVPKTAAHQAEPGFDDCYRCHAIHKAPTAAATYCNGCHHKNVFECGTCHGA